MGNGMYIYHYHATTQVEQGKIENIDGIASMENEIVSFDTYKHFKAAVARDMTVSAERLTICSLTLLKSGA